MLLRDSLLICCIAVFSMQWGWSQAIEASESESTIFDHLNPRIKQFTLQDGLSQVSANDLIHDKNGVVWIATQDGLNRFDGTEFNHYKYSDSDSNTVSGNLINKLLEDRGGGIWVGTIGNGLSYYDPIRDVFHRISLQHAWDSNEIITAFAEDQKGTIWVASRLSGLHRLEHVNDQDYKQSLLLPKESLGALLVDEAQNLWIGAYQGNLYKLPLNNSTALDPMLIESDLGHIQALHNTDTHLFIGSDIGFFMYAHETGQVDMIELENSGAFKTRHVLDFLVRDQTSIWIATGNGLYLFDWTLRTVIEKLQNSDDNHSLSNNTVQTLLALEPNKILAGTANYLNLIDFSPPYFKTISKNKSGQHLLNDNVIFSIFKDEHGLWVGTSDGGLNLIQNNVVYHITEDENIPTSIAGSVVRAIVKDEINQRLWIATTRGLSLMELKDFDPAHPRFIVFHHNPNNNTSINSDFIKDLALDNNDNLWGATYGEGVFKLEMDANGKVQITQYKHDNHNSNSLVNNFTQCIRVDRNNHIWVGTQGGCSHLEFSNQVDGVPIFNNYYKDPKFENSLSHNSVYDILFDNKNQIWLATRHGLNKFLGNNEFKSWTEQDQLPNAVIYGIQDDDDNKLWLGTNDGLVKFDPENEEFEHYSVADGIQSPEFDIHARFKDEQGNIYMGGIAGLTYFNPAHLEDIDIATPLYFSKLRVKSKRDKVLDNTTQVTLEPMADNINLTFNYNQFPFYLEFSSIDYRFQKNVAYAYKLLPNDEAWNILNDTKIQFLNLKPGKYELQVNGFSRGIEWDQKPLSMNLTIRAPLWATWWAYLIYLGLMLSTGYVFYKFRLSKKMAVAESLKLKELDILKDQFYANITHEFRTPLTVISGMAEALEKNLKKEPQKKINLIKKNSQNLLALVNQMLDLSKLQAGKISSKIQQSDVIFFLKYITESHQSYAKLKNVGLQFYSEESELLLDFDAGHLEKVLNNLISNAVKFTNEYGNILVVAKKTLTNGKPELEIKVKDTGIGISKDALPHIYDRYHQVNPIHGDQGSGIGLALVKELMGIMRGSISVESELQSGTTFLMRFPMTTDAQLIKPKSIDIKKPSLMALDHVVFESEEIDHNLPILLIIEDNIDITYYLRTCFEEKYHIITAVNGKVGIEKATEELPDMIISDVMMPEMDGFEVCEILKKDERTNHIPIILLTAKATPEDKLSGLSYGADAYLIKPFKKEELEIRMENLMEIRRTLQAKYSSSLLSSQKLEEVLSKEEGFVKRLEEIILTHLDDESFSIHHLSRELTLSRSQAHRKIKALTGMSTAIYIRHVRLQKAKELLLFTGLPISEIAYQVGFRTLPYFSQAFKETFGESPSATRI